MMRLIKVEWLRLRHSASARWIMGIFFLSGLIAILLGKGFNEAQVQEIAGLEQQFQEQWARLEHRYEENGAHSGYWAYYSAFPVAQPPQSLSALSWGLRDVSPSVIWVRILGLEQQLYESGMGSSLLQSLGHFDLGFVVSVLAPLVLLLLCHDVISRDRTLGTMSLLAAQSGALEKVFFARILLRCVLVLLLCVFLFGVAVWVLNLPLTMTTWGWLCIALAGLLPWCVISAVIAARAQQVSSSLVAALSCFVGFMILLPALCNVLLSNRFPVTEGLELTVRQRQVMHDGWDQPKQFNYDKFLSTRPEYRNYPSVPEDAFSWRWYYGMHEVADSSVKGISKQYIETLRDRQLWSQRLAWLSPPAMTQTMLCAQAATDVESYLSHLEKTRAFHEELKDYFFPLIFSETILPPGATKYFPQCRFDYASLPPINYLPHLVFSILLLPFSRLRAAVS